MMMVFISWISFTVKADAVPGRLGLLLMLLLMMINMNNTVSSNIPKSSKVTPITFWIIGSIFFVYSAILEYAFILVLMKFRTTNKLNLTENDLSRSKESPRILKQTITLDKLSLGLFPFAYFSFVIFFVLFL